MADAPRSDAPTADAPRARGILEHALYGPDLEALERFYVDVFGLALLTRAENRLTALRCGNATLLLFDPAVSGVPGPIPEHGCTGAGHVAFAVQDDELPGWREQFRRHGLAIEREIEWEEGGTSLYVRDPAGNSVELAPPGIWGGLGRALLDSLGR
jgi:catechol 2,3-dioxygenase-like lactoylglutathione lyase family enzyme